MIGAVDIGGTKFAVAMVSEDGKVLARAETPSMPERGLANGVSRIVNMLHQTADQAGGKIHGIGIGCTGSVFPMTGKLGPIEFLPGWEGFNLVAEMERQFGVSAFMENDAAAAALGESAWGVGKGAERFIYLTVSTGIGGGMVINGNLYRGAGNSHPEMGHHVIDPSGPKCFCGAYGCWESLASGTALAKRGKRATARDVCESFRRGDADAITAIEQEGFYLGLGLANLITMLVPDIIALGGGVMESRELFWDKMNETIRTMCGLVPYENTRILPASLGRDVGLLGAAQVWIKWFGQ
jgi:glucokinase